MPRIILLTMIKNEEKIIERCIRSVLGLVDAVCVVDTGSTDKTSDVVNNVFDELKIPHDWSCDNWENFGHNRTLSFKHAVDFCKIQLGWDLADTYALLLDADMRLVVGDLQKETLTAQGYTVEQRGGGLRYYNTRLVRLDIPWKCVGVTHEYWSVGTTEKLDPSNIYIDDIGDGGAKADKFTRDIRLLREGLETDPNNERYLFYLAQSYKDTKNYARAIQFYKRRIQAEGWQEEVWYSHYMIAKCWMYLQNELKMDYWANRAFAYRKSRAEPLYMLTKYYREQGNQLKAYYYWSVGSKIPKTNDILFVETPDFDYEYTILQYYVFPKDHVEGLRASIRYINEDKSLSRSVYSNSKFYLERLKGRCFSLHVDPVGDYVPSSTSCVRIDNDLLLNVRYVNYRIQSNGSYKMCLNGNIVDNDKIRTRNAWTWYSTPDLHFMTDPDIPKKEDHRIVGLEDVRLFTSQGHLRFIATSPQYSYCDKYRMITGRYDYQSGTYQDCVSIRPPTETQCEKNWIPIEEKFIYKWQPLQIGEIQGNQLIITQEHETPSWFQHLRGSSNAVLHQNAYWLIVHGIYGHIPRQYFHQIVQLDEKTLKVKKYSLPFYFKSLGIEYCLGLDIQADSGRAFVSSNDADPFVCSFSLDSLVWIDGTGGAV
jgi:glycosyltransferase involved in cell wall biosynthesis